MASEAAPVVPTATISMLRQALISFLRVFTLPGEDEPLYVAQVKRMKDNFKRTLWVDWRHIEQADPDLVSFDLSEFITLSRSYFSQ